MCITDNAGGLHGDGTHGPRRGDQPRLPGEHHSISLPSISRKDPQVQSPEL